MNERKKYINDFVSNGYMWGPITYEQYQDLEELAQEMPGYIGAEIRDSLYEIGEITGINKLLNKLNIFLIKLST